MVLYDGAMPHKKSELLYGHCDSPIGLLFVAGDGDRLHEIRFPTEKRAPGSRDGWRHDNARFADVFKQLNAYFAGELTRFDLPLLFDGTEFQNRVWKALCDIPYGATSSYGALASRIGKPTASRAVGGANGANPLPIVVPCHRVIGADKSLTGFGGGVDVKKFLLDHEHRIAPQAGSQGSLAI